MSAPDRSGRVRTSQSGRAVLKRVAWVSVVAAVVLAAVSLARSSNTTPHASSSAAPSQAVLLSRMEAVANGYATANRLHGFRVDHTDIVHLSGGRAVIGTGRASNGRDYLCFLQPAQSGGCTALGAGGLAKPFGGVTLIGGDRYEISVAVPRGTRAASVIGGGGESKVMDLDEGVAVTTARASEISALVWTRADGTNGRQRLVTGPQQTAGAP
jgi:hypothetical protein